MTAASDKIIRAASDPAFCQRVAFLALKTAQKVTAESPETPNNLARVLYADQVLRGDDKAVLLAMHVVAASPAIVGNLENEAEVSDEDIEAALDAVWDGRSAAYARVNEQYAAIQRVVTQVNELQASYVAAEEESGA